MAEPIIDTHVHIISPELRREAQHFIEKDDFLAQICSSPVHKFASVEDLLAEMERCRVQKAAVCSFPFSDEGICREVNDYLLEAARNYPGRFLPMVAVDPRQRWMEREIARCHDAGAAGVGELFPWGQQFDLAGNEASQLASYCCERGLPLLLHVNEPVGHEYAGKGTVSVKEAANFALGHPQLQIIYAHWGGGLFFYELMPELKQGLKHLFYDTAASPFLYRPAIYRVAREIGLLHKILLGTDYPLISPRRYLQELASSGLSPAEQKLVCSENARRLFPGFCT
ncbi:MAG: amidohydrolase family protein [Dethiobacteria bacterium]|nr:amidohydrolase family protein [Bacillota bacterium]HOB29160.1 amidohydrolase family protein [Bacillota bacterium]HPZ41772.1 amidohydrolase family protein [Bacillota bacterium]HQD52584.1 amidohydrolase family protein [Bacillota bacterium]